MPASFISSANKSPAEDHEKDIRGNQRTVMTYGLGKSYLTWQWRKQKTKGCSSQTLFLYLYQFVPECWSVFMEWMDGWWMGGCQCGQLATQGRQSCRNKGNWLNSLGVHLFEDYPHAAVLQVTRHIPLTWRSSSILSCRLMTMDLQICSQRVTPITCSVRNKQ
jgi:hypothetical protein